MWSKEAAMDIRQLRYFLQVCQHGSILQASQHIFISQQALSKAISSLEQEIGVPLFFRTPRGLVPTEVGRQLQQLAGPVVSAMDDLVAQITLSANLSSNRINIGIVPGFQFFLSPPAIKELCGQFPALELRTEEYPVDRCESMVADGALSIGLVNGPISDPRLMVIPVSRRRRAVLIPITNPLAEKDLISIKDLEGQNLLMSINSKDRALFSSLCRRAGFEPRASYTSEHTLMMEYCDQEGYIGCCMDLSLLRSHPRYPNLIARPFDPEEFSFSVDIIVNPTQYNRKVVQELCDRIFQIVRSLDGRAPQFPYTFS